MGELTELVPDIKSVSTIIAYSFSISLYYGYKLSYTFYTAIQAADFIVGLR